MITLGKEKSISTIKVLGMTKHQWPDHSCETCQIFFFLFLSFGCLRTWQILEERFLLFIMEKSSSETLVVCTLKRKQLCSCHIREESYQLCIKNYFNNRTDSDAMQIS